MISKDCDNSYISKNDLMTFIENLTTTVLLEGLKNICFPKEEETVSENSETCRK